MGVIIRYPEIQNCYSLNVAGSQIFANYSNTINNGLGVITSDSITLGAGSGTKAPVTFDAFPVDSDVPRDFRFIVNGYPNYLYIFIRDSADFVPGLDWPGATGTGSINMVIGLIDGVFSGTPVVYDPGTQFNYVDVNNDYIGNQAWLTFPIDYDGNPYNGKEWKIRFLHTDDMQFALQVFVGDDVILAAIFNAENTLFQDKKVMFGFDHWNASNSIQFLPLCP
jgi:hypothetical protein